MIYISVLFVICSISIATFVSNMGTLLGAEPEVYTQRPRIIAVNFDPYVDTDPSAGTDYKRLHIHARWGDPNVMTTQWIDFMAEASHDILDFKIVRQINVDHFPVKYDGFRYTNEDENTPGSYLYARKTGNWHSPDGIDYKSVVRNYDLARRCDKGELGEAVINGAPYFGYYETRMIGKGAYWCNSSGLKTSANAKKFIAIGWNYERWTITGHAYGHRAESIMSEVYDGWSVNGNRTIWDRFGWNIGQTTISSIYGVGSAHYPCNGDSGYDYGNSQTVTSYAIDWMNNFPNFRGATSSVNCSDWNCNQTDYFKWWYQHMPHVDGRNNHDGYDRLNNWWGYIQDLNRWPESGGEMIGAGLSLPSGPSAVRITTNNREDFNPRINSSGRIVWSGYDGSDFEIYSANSDGSGLVQITNNSYIDEDPRINSSGRIVWQSFIEKRYEIFCADADGSNLVQITNNSTNDWHPDINDSGRIVWDRFDGDDYEIYSANSDGTDIVQLTDNEATSGMPTDDCWPQIDNPGRVVWMGYDGNDWEIYSTYSDGHWPITNISDNSYDDEYPQINNSGRVVWHTYYYTGKWDIWSAYADGGIGLTRITDTSREDWYPRINSSGKVVWMSFDGDDWEIYTANQDGTGLTSLTNNSVQDMHPVIDDIGGITWQSLEKNDPPNDQNNDDDWEIITYIDETTYRITDNDIDDRAPAVSPYGGIVWHADAGALGESDIYTVENDLDGDGLPDNWEMLYFGNLDQGADDDYDLDDLTNLQEYELGTNPTNSNTDGDGVDDGDEVQTGTDPLIKTYYVDDAIGSDSYDGLLPDIQEGHGPKKTIQAAIDAYINRNEVVVASGTYSGSGNKDLDPGGKAILLWSSDGAETTIIDCENSGRGIYCSSIAGPGALIKGFTIINGNASPDGGAIYCESSIVTIENCIIEDNSSDTYGGGISVTSNSNATIINCLLTGNSSGDKGGGIHCGSSNITINNLTAEGNSATNFGGAVMISWGSEGTITDSILWGNTAAEGDEIALKATANPSTLTVSYCDVEGGESEVHVMSGCTLNWGSGNIDSSPVFASGPFGDYYLSQTAAGQASDSPCVDAGTDVAANLGLDTLTTRTDGFPDEGIVDMGYHYPVSYDILITSIEITGDDVTIYWNARPGISYTVQHSTNMVDWTDVPVGETDTWTDTNVSETTKFYRVVEQ